MKILKKRSRFIFFSVVLALIAMILAGCSASDIAESAEQESNEITNSGAVTNVPVVATATNSKEAGSVLLETPSSPQATLTEAVPNNPASPSDVSFSKDILPILQKSCVSCHGGEKTSKGLDLKTFSSTLAGSQNGPVIVAGNSDGSKLIQSVISGKMPKRGAKLTTEQIQLLINWVNAGAKDN